MSNHGTETNTEVTVFQVQSQVPQSLAEVVETVLHPLEQAYEVVETVVEAVEAREVSAVALTTHLQMARPTPEVVEVVSVTPGTRM